MLKSTPRKITLNSLNSKKTTEVKFTNRPHTSQVETRWITKEKHACLAPGLWTNAMYAQVPSRLYLMRMLLWLEALTSNKDTYADWVTEHTMLNVHPVRAISQGARTLGTGVWLSGHLPCSKDNVYNVGSNRSLISHAINAVSSKRNRKTAKLFWKHAWSRQQEAVLNQGLA